MSIVNIEFVTDGTFNATFEVQTNSDTWHSVSAINLGSMQVENSATNKASLYMVDLTAVSKLRVKINNTSNPISVYGKVVS